MKKITMAVLGIAAITALTTTAASAAVVTSSANVRSGPGLGYHVVDSLYRGDRVRITDQEGRWCEVSIDGPDGWVLCAYLADEHRDYYYEEPSPSIGLSFGFGSGGYGGGYGYGYPPHHHPHHMGPPPGGMWPHH